MKQRRDNWEECYQNNHMPWDTGHNVTVLQTLTQQYLTPGLKLLEIGCGSGTEAINFAKLGFNVTAIDISQSAIELAKKKADQENVNIDFQTVDLTQGLAQFEKFDVIFDRACFHTYTDNHSREKFAGIISEILKTSGYWFDISGNSDHRDDAGEINASYPKLRLQDIAQATEKYFQIIEVKLDTIVVHRENYGDINGLAWLVIMSKR